MKDLWLWEGMAKALLVTLLAWQAFLLRTDGHDIPAPVSGLSRTTAVSAAQPTMPETASSPNKAAPATPSAGKTSRPRKVPDVATAVTEPVAAANPVNPSVSTDSSGGAGPNRFVLDADGNHKVEVEEMKRWRLRYDKNKDGKVLGVELAAGQQAIAEFASVEAVRLADRDADGAVSPEEYQVAIHDFDLNGNGQLDPDEIEKFHRKQLFTLVQPAAIELFLKLTSAH